MNETLSERPLDELDPLCAPSRWRRQWPTIGYAFTIALAAALLIPFPEVGSWITNAFAEICSGSGGVFPAFVIVFGYTSYCCVLLAKRKLTPLHHDRLQLAEHFAYSAGLLGIIIRLVSLSHSTTENFDPKTLLGALTPFKIGFSLWVLVVAVRWLAEHIATIDSNRNNDEN
jgi:hypothetical protein